MTPAKKTLRLGIVGLGWMGQVHARAATRLAHHYGDLPAGLEVAAIADPATDGRLEQAGQAYGAGLLTADWQELVASPDIDIVSVAGPNFTHRDVAVAAARAGKHLWIEKPAGRSTAESREIAEAVRAAGVQSAVGFNYRQVPAVQLARQLIADGELGAIRHVEVHLYGDYSAHPDGALTWRFIQDLAGGGAVADLGSHAVDLIEHVVGPVEAVLGDLATFIDQRPRPTGTVSHFSRATGGELAPVENEDYGAALLRLRGGGRGLLSTSRVFVGEQNTYGFTVHGEKGSLTWDFRRIGELEVSIGQDYQGAAWTTRRLGPTDGVYSRFQPDTAISMSYDDLKVIELAHLIAAITTGEVTGAGIEDVVRSSTVTDAIIRSAAEERWIEV